MKKNNKHIGTSFDDFLNDEGITEEVDALAARKVIALSLAEALVRQQMTKAEFARRMGTSRSTVNRILDPNNPGLTFASVAKASRVLRMRMKVEMVEA